IHRQYEPIRNNEYPGMAIQFIRRAHFNGIAVYPRRYTIRSTMRVRSLEITRVKMAFETPRVRPRTHLRAESSRIRSCRHHSLHALDGYSRGWSFAACLQRGEQRRPGGFALRNRPAP